jgi:hypothetical protein
MYGNRPYTGIYDEQGYKPTDHTKCVSLELVLAKYKSYIQTGVLYIPELQLVCP